MPSHELTECPTSKIGFRHPHHLATDQKSFPTAIFLVGFVCFIVLSRRQISAANGASFFIMDHSQLLSCLPFTGEAYVFYAEVLSSHTFPTELGLVPPLCLSIRLYFCFVR